MGRLKNFENFDGFNLMSDVFVETGTFQGETLDAAITAGYPEVHTIDVVPDYAKQAKARHQDKSHVYCHAGTSPDILLEILDKSKFTTFWLDGHYQHNTEEEQCFKYGQCPVLDELKVIFSIEWEKMPLILIDDARLFSHGVDERFKAEDWPSRQQILELVPPGYNTDDYADIIFLYPETFKKITL